VDDTDRTLAIELGMLDAEEKDAAGAPMTARAVFLVG
jgi:alkyl hydroperoxide reductase subunit AhpC